MNATPRPRPFRPSAIAAAIVIVAALFGTAAVGATSSCATTTTKTTTSWTTSSAAAFVLSPTARRCSKNTSSPPQPSVLSLKAASSSSSSSSSTKAPLSSRIILPTSQDGGNKKVFQLQVDLPTGAGADASTSGPKLQALLTAEPVFSGPSVLVEIKYRVPFELNVEPVNNLALCTKDGPSIDWSERKGDVLRFTSQWTLGLPRQVGLAATAAAFSGGLSWQSSMFDVMKAVKWEQVVNALVSNTQDRTSEVILIFERPVQEADDGGDAEAQ